MRRSLERAWILLALWLVPAVGAKEPLGHEVYLSQQDALRLAFEDVARVERVEIALTPEEHERISKRARGGRRLYEKQFTVYRGLRNGSVRGYAVITEEIGKYQPITFIVSVTPTGKVQDVAVMVYREHIGNDVRRRRFLSQFIGKQHKDRFRLHRDIINISGATLSVRAISRGVKKVLCVVEECVLGPERRRELRWSPVVLEPPVESADRGPVEEVRYLMGTVLEARGYGQATEVRAALRAALAEVARLEGLLSTYRPESELSRVNRDADRGPVEVSPETYACLEAALGFAARSGGAFDPTRVRGGHREVELDPERRTVRFRRPGLTLDLGGIGKGFALDRAAEVLERRGIDRALLNFGGQILALEPPPGEPAWIVAVRDPRSSAEVLGYYEVVRGSVSTSGTEERGGHIVDPRTGAASRRILSATVCARTATAADALSTAVQVLGARAGIELVDSAGAAAVVLDGSAAEPMLVGDRSGPTFVRVRGSVAGRPAAK